jgi:hypothetical protein
MESKLDNSPLRDLLLVALATACGAVDALSFLGLGKSFPRS